MDLSTLIVFFPVFAAPYLFYLMKTSQSSSVRDFSIVSLVLIALVYGVGLIIALFTIPIFWEFKFKPDSRNSNFVKLQMIL